MKSKIVKCVDCGEEHPRKELNRNFRCPDCAGRIMMKTIGQLMYKEGPEYEKWKAGLRAALNKL